MNHKKSISILLSLILLVIIPLSGCNITKSTTDGPKTSVEYEAQIKQLQEEINDLKKELAQYVHINESESTPAVETISAEESSAAEDESGSHEPTEEKKQVVVFGDSIWDSARDETGIAYLLSQYMNADVYNCAIGGTRATLKDGESPDNFENWDSTSLSGLVNVAIGTVDPEIFLEGYVAGGIIRNIDFSKTDYFVISYGLNDYFSGAPINADGGSSWDAHGYGGALRFAINRLNTKFPDAQILLISPTYCQFLKDGVMYTDSNMRDFGQGSLTQYANACRNVAETQNTLYIDAYSTMGINNYTAEDYLDDGIHLTAKGRDLYAKAVSSCLKYGKPGQVSGNSIYY
nr:GDSL-type esterase/lipase family protein [uncultured Eisenbergiella sp.]